MAYNVPKCLKKLTHSPGGPHIVLAIGSTHLLVSSALGTLKRRKEKKQALKLLSAMFEYGVLDICDRGMYK